MSHPCVVPSLRPLLVAGLALALGAPLAAAPKQGVMIPEAKGGSDGTQNGVMVPEKTGGTKEKAGIVVHDAQGGAVAATTRPQIKLMQTPDPKGPNLYPKIAVFATPPYKDLIEDGATGISGGGSVNVQVYIHNKGAAPAPAGTIKNRVVIKRGGSVVVDQTFTEAEGLAVGKVWAHQFPVSCPGKSNAIQVNVWADSGMGVAETIEKDNFTKYVANVQVLH